MPLQQSEFLVHGALEMPQHLPVLALQSIEPQQSSPVLHTETLQHLPPLHCMPYWPLEPPQSEDE